MFADLAQGVAQRRPTVTHLAVSSRGRFLKPRPGNVALVAGGIWPGQRRRGRPGGEGAQCGADGLAAVGASCGIPRALPWVDFGVAIVSRVPR